MHDHRRAPHLTVAIQGLSRGRLRAAPLTNREILASIGNRRQALRTARAGAVTASSCFAARRRSPGPSPGSSRSCLSSRSPAPSGSADRQARSRTCRRPKVTCHLPPSAFGNGRTNTSSWPCLSYASQWESGDSAGPSPSYLVATIWRATLSTPGRTARMSAGLEAPAEPAVTSTSHRPSGLQKPSVEESFDHSGRSWLVQSAVSSHRPGPLAFEVVSGGIGRLKMNVIARPFGDHRGTRSFPG